MNGLSRDQLIEFGKKFFNSKDVTLEPVFHCEEDAHLSVPDLGCLIYAQKLITRPRTNMIATNYAINLYDKTRFKYGQAITVVFDNYDGTHLFDVKQTEDVFFNQLAIQGSIGLSYWGYEIRPVY